MAKENVSTQVEDYSDDIRALYQRRFEARRAALEQAYNENLARLEREEETIMPTYAALRNRTAAQAAVEQQRFDEYANASGLGSGAAGQSTLARSVALQNDLAALRAGEREERASIEDERRALSGQFESAIASALAEGEAEMAQALYEERQRREAELEKLEAQSKQAGQTETQPEPGAQSVQTGSSSTQRAPAAQESTQTPSLDELFDAMAESGTPYTYLTANYKRYGIGSGAASTLQSIYEEYTRRQAAAEGSEREHENYTQILDSLAVRSAEQGSTPTDYIRRLEQRAGADYYRNLVGETLYRRLLENVDRYAQAYAAMRRADDPARWLKANRDRYGEELAAWLESKL